MDRTRFDRRYSGWRRGFGRIFSCQDYRLAQGWPLRSVRTPVSLSGSGKESGRPATWAAGGSANPEREPDLARITPAFMEPSTKRRRFIRDGRDQQIDGWGDRQPDQRTEVPPGRVAGADRGSQEPDGIVWGQDQPGEGPVGRRRQAGEAWNGARAAPRWRNSEKESSGRWGSGQGARPQA